MLQLLPQQTLGSGTIPEDDESELRFPITGPQGPRRVCAALLAKPNTHDRCSESSHSSVLCLTCRLIPPHQFNGPILPSPPDVPGVLNALAFSPPLLPRLWTWLCFALGLPRSCPAAATRGLDVAALGGGYAGLRPHSARVLGLFCRWGPSGCAVPRVVAGLGLVGPHLG